MKNVKMLMAVTVVTFMLNSAMAQEKNMVLNHSFESLSGNVCAPGAILLADSITSSNNTTVDVFSNESNSIYYNVPENYMGTQQSKTGNNYAGFIAYYADDAGFFKIVPGYRQYSEYTQMKLSEPLIAGKSYDFSYNISLAEKSAYAVSGFGVCFTNSKLNEKDNAFLNIRPDIIWADLQTNTEWTTLSSTYVAFGGEQYLTIGCFKNFISAEKVISPNMNNSRKAYYYLDEIGLAPSPINTEVEFSLSSIMIESCFKLENLNFETDKSVILETSFKELNLLSSFLKMYPNISIYLDGYTDKTGTKEYNVVLSEARAEAVKKYLVKDGVEENRLLARGFGEALPIDKANENSLANRRVEITLCDFSKE